MSSIHDFLALRNRREKKKIAAPNAFLNAQYAISDFNQLAVPSPLFMIISQPETLPLKRFGSSV